MIAHLEDVVLQAKYTCIVAELAAGSGESCLPTPTESNAMFLGDIGELFCPKLMNHISLASYYVVVDLVPNFCW